LESNYRSSDPSIFLSSIYRSVLANMRIDGEFWVCPELVFTPVQRTGKNLLMVINYSNIASKLLFKKK
jgi:hypothetical protein